MMNDVSDVEVMRLWELYGYTTPFEVQGIVPSAMMEVVEWELSCETEFKKALLMLALNEIICPTICQRISVNCLPAVVVAENAKEYDWCIWLLDHLMH